MTTTLRWPAGRGRFVDRSPDRIPDDVDARVVTPGTTVDIDDSDIVDTYLDRGFQRVDGSSDADTDSIDADAADGFDISDFLDRTPVAVVVDDIEDGVADDHLDDVQAAADRVTVERAVDDRKETLGA